MPPKKKTRTQREEVQNTTVEELTLSVGSSEPERLLKSEPDYDGVMADPDWEEEEREEAYLRRRRKIPDTLTAHQEQNLVQWFAQNPCFWDRGDAHFRDRQRKDCLLLHKAREFNLTCKNYILQSSPFLILICSGIECI